MTLPQPKIAIPADRKEWIALREQAHETGLRIIKDRQYRHDYRPLGVHFWVGKVMESGCKFDDGDIRRRINELAFRPYWNVAPWVHLPVKYEDVKPSMNQRLTLSYQSSYLPNPLFDPDMEAFCLRATKIDDILRFLDWSHPEENLSQIQAA